MTHHSIHKKSQNYVTSSSAVAVQYSRAAAKEQISNQQPFVNKWGSRGINGKYDYEFCFTLMNETVTRNTCRIAIKIYNLLRKIFNICYYLNLIHPLVILVIVCFIEKGELCHSSAGEMIGEVEKQ